MPNKGFQDHPDPFHLKMPEKQAQYPERCCCECSDHGSHYLDFTTRKKPCEEEMRHVFILFMIAAFLKRSIAEQLFSEYQLPRQYACVVF